MTAGYWIVESTVDTASEHFPKGACDFRPKQGKGLLVFHLSLQVAFLT